MALFRKRVQQETPYDDWEEVPYEEETLPEEEEMLTDGLVDYDIYVMSPKERAA